MGENVIYLDNRLVIDDGILAEYIPSEEHDKYKKAPGDARRFNMLEQMLRKRSSDTYKVDCILGSLYEIIKADRAGDFTIEVVEELLGDVENIIQSISTEKKVYGEVLTPLSLVNEMLDTLPVEVWSDPNKKWLDPANGTGAFMMVVYYRLIKGLEGIIPDINQRRKHILENMLYIGELQNETSIIFLSMVDFHDDVRVNIFSGDTLSKEFDEHVKNVWKVDKFDIVVGNPPYNAYQEAKGKRGGGDSLWDKFVIKSIEKWLIERGYLVFVHPTLWRKPQSKRSSSKKVSEIMLSKQIHYLECHDSNDGMRVFGAGTRYDFYLLENTPIYKKTIINGEDRKNVKVDIRKYDFIPNYNIDLFDKIKTNDYANCPIIYNRTNYGTDKEWVSDTEDSFYRYKLVHTTPKKGNRWAYSSRNDNGHFGVSKVIFGDSGIYDVIIDMDGEYGMTQHSMAIKVDTIEEAENIKTALLSDKFQDFLKTTMWSNFQIDWRLFMYLRRDFWKEFI